VSLAAYLQDLGYDVWIPELRGDPGAVAPNRKARAYTFDDHATYDIPAVVDTVLAASDADQLLWVGHSMGGMLLYTALETESDKIAAGVVLGSPAVITEMTGLESKLSHNGWVVGHRGRLEVSGPAAALSAMFGRGNLLYGRLAVRSNLDWPVTNGLAEHALIDVSRPMAHQAVSWLRSGAITRVDGTPWIVGGADVPLLAFGGSRDKIVPASNVEESCALYPSCRYVLLGKDSGFSVDYGHVDPVLGLTAPAEVYPLISAFLAEHRPVETPAVAEP
jgi:pimeloyl-ACP methyl ester carboxylesterase